MHFYFIAYLKTFTLCSRTWSNANLNVGFLTIFVRQKRVLTFIHSVWKILKHVVYYRRSFPSTELLSVEISLDSDSQRMEGTQNGGAWCTGNFSSYIYHCICSYEWTRLYTSVDPSRLPLQKRTTHPPWWVCVAPWLPSPAANRWRASSPVSAWSISAQRTVLPCLPARGRQRRIANDYRHYEKHSFGLEDVLTFVVHT